jgi:hypothetical protein
MAPDLRASALAARVGLDLPRRDPLAYRRMSSVAQRDACEYVAQGVETYWHAGKAGGKTEGLAHLFVAMCRGLKRLDGRIMVRRGPEWIRALDRRQPRAPQDENEPHWITLPGLHDGEAWRHWVIVNSYDQARHSSVRAYRRLLGKWPHEIGWLDGSRSGRVKTIRVKPDGWLSDDPATWSEIMFISQEGMTEEDVRRVQGARIDSCHGDEAPGKRLWQEIRARQDAGRRLYLGIGYTPQVRAEWEWLLSDEGFAHCYRQPVGGRVRIQSGVEDNRAMSLIDLRDRWRKAKGDPEFEARWNGEHVDVSSMCPFPHAPMDRLLAACVRGRRERYIVREPSESMPNAELAVAEIERWLEHNPRHRYLIVVDTSRGIDDGKHDPAELEVWDWTTGHLVCRFGQRDGAGGYLDEDALALLAEMLGKEYGNALVDWEVTGGYGLQFGATLRRVGYPNMAHDDRTLSPGVVRTEYGWVASASTNGEIVNALITGLKDGSFSVWSADVVRQWKDVRMAKDGTTPGVKKGARHHREAMICAGRALHWIQTRAATSVPESQAPDAMREALRNDFGRPISLGKHKGRRGMTEIFRPDA